MFQVILRYWWRMNKSNLHIQTEHFISINTELLRNNHFIPLYFAKYKLKKDSKFIW